MHDQKKYNLNNLIMLEIVLLNAVTKVNFFDHFQQHIVSKAVFILYKVLFLFLQGDFSRVFTIWIRGLKCIYLR